jgi:UDP-N-acetylglucosamine--N-acetylmuramyl-(pentapeptide) pyrophosphoryl-undecaprenol N-acetylglucosamine transferase
MAVHRVLITAGKTGGHLYPAQALAQQLMKTLPPSNILFVADGLSINRYFDRAQFHYQEVACSPLSLRHPLKTGRGLISLIRGCWQSRTILKHFQPHVVVGFGSYPTVPVLLAARSMRIPIILHEANSIPGKANRWLAPLADYVGVHFPSTAQFFKDKAVEVGLPLREGYQLSAVSQEAARAYYGLNPYRSTLLVCGGSQGARTINHLMLQVCASLNKQSLQIIHLTGDASTAQTLATLYANHQIPAHVKAFEDQMQMAWRAADIFIGRAGASTIAEAIEFEVPGLLIPYRHATDQHQDKNADFLTHTIGAAWKVPEEGLTPVRFAEILNRFYQTGQDLLFKDRLKQYKMRSHPMSLYELVMTTMNLSQEKVSADDRFI